MMLRREKGQSTLEYALIISVVIVALLSLNNYIKRSVSGRLKASSDEIGRQFDASGNYTFNWTLSSDGNTTTIENRTGGNITTNITTAETITRKEEERWGPDVLGL
ncbi:MAG: hypothetical protein NC923_04530 [Candidatus Omnitrophica bacterium]|nr:hypothetical protein [Candidatus Omnitrophota bacterium]